MEKDLQTLNQQEKEQLWARRVMECRDSGLTVTKWCSENDVKVPTFYTWQRKLFQKAKQEQKFTEISVTEPPTSTILSPLPQVIATLTIDEVKVEIYAGSSSQDIQNLIRGLKSC